MTLFHLLAVGIVMLCATATLAALRAGGGVRAGEDAGLKVGVTLEAAVRQLAENHLPECFLVVVAAEERASTLTPMARSLWAVFYPFVWVGVGEAAATATATTTASTAPTTTTNTTTAVAASAPTTAVPIAAAASHLQRHLQVRDPRFTCHAFLLDLSQPLHSDPLLQFLEDTHLHLWPETRVVGVGPPLPSLPDIRALLTQPALRNTAHALFLALHAHSEGSVDASGSEAKEGGKEGNCDGRKARGGVCGGRVEVFRRCLYCQRGGEGVYLVTRWNAKALHDTHASTPATPTPSLFPDEFHMFGHRFRIVSMDWYPFLSFRRNSNASATTVTPLDSLDYRMLTAVSRVLNFTYEMRVPWDDQWGVSQDNGNWTGTVGTLQHHQADFSMLLSWMPSRMAVVDYSRVYISEPLVIVTRKPGPLPQIFALVRPFPDVLWVAVVLASVAAGVVMWAMDWAWWRVCGEGVGVGMAGRRGLSSSLLASWRILLEDPDPYLPTSMTGQMLVGWWWVFCMLLTNAYRSSLIAHLSVPDESPPINTLEDLLQEKGYTWGMEATYGVGWQWFKESSVPSVKQVYAKIQVLDAEEHLARVLEGQHAFLTWKYYIRSLIGAHYTNSRGYTPLYTGRQEYINYGGYGWGFRKGAPVRRSIDLVKQRLIEAGVVKHWMNDLIATASRKARRKNTARPALPAKFSQEAGGAELVVLGVGQLQGAFYLLGLGLLLGLVMLVAEALLRVVRKGLH
ncbi:glutamate receptor ionotropic, kainate 3-like [Eriocheir sinensis]|uniref:glutamate receptor ionotropic, kainate 3-like n=1 Tax=Eriocheir sinensis TaxID=95602 RepID=UPI0021C6851C|nr:glutamate receptor ionotropic, kainate 3-like [Eriocheir sinensis]